MADNALLDALPDEPVLQSNSLGTVTASCVVLRTANGPASTILSLAAVREVRRVKTTYPGLLVIAAALGLIAVAAFASKQGHGAHIPAGLLALTFLTFYFGSRKASVLFVVGDENIESTSGTFREAGGLLRAVEAARRKL